MNQYLSILLRNQFNLFYRFGYTYIPQCQLLAFDGVINDSTKEDLIKLFFETTPFEWDEEYLILHFDKSEVFQDHVINFQIQDIVKVYPLSAQAKSSIETKIDHRIRLEKPVFENILPKIEQKIEKHEIEKAIQALWNICGIEDDLNTYISNIGLDNIFKGLERRKTGTKSNQIKDCNYWEYVLAYDRFDYFPNSILGYFYDAGQIFANTKGLSTFEGSGLYNFLQSINNSNPEIKFKEINKILETEEQGKKYVSQTTSNDQLQYLITPLFLMLKDGIRKADDIKNTNLIKHLKTLKEFGTSFNYAVILLGAFFGFKKFYDAYYDNLNLRFYKSFQTEKAINKSILVKNQPGLMELISSQKGSVSEDDNVLENKLKVEIESLATEHLSSEEIAVTTELISTDDMVKSKEQESLTKHNQQIIEGLGGRDNIELKIIDEILPTDNIESEVSKNPMDHPTKSNLDTETVIRIQNIIIELLIDKTEMKLTDMGVKIKEAIGQKITNTIIRDIIKSIENIEIVPNKKPERARKIIMQDLFNTNV
jgi:hypothetical protein